MAAPETDPEVKLETLKLVIYLVPIFGFFPALWSLYMRSGGRREQQVSRTAVVLAMAWVMTYVLTGAGAQLADAASARLLITGLLATTGYFVTNLWLMVRLLQGHTPRLPGVNRLSDRLK
jgi:hypothetical protein